MFYNTGPLYVIIAGIYTVFEAKEEQEPALENVNSIKLFPGDHQPPEPVYTVLGLPMVFVAVNNNVSDTFENVISSPTEGVDKPIEGARD
jgi:hypothetical protein